MKYIFIASPYIIGNQALNVRASLLAAEDIMQSGFIPHVPLLYHFWNFMSPKPESFWRILDTEWLARCDAVVRLPGLSVGADAEVELARRLGLPVFFGVEQFLEWTRDSELYIRQLSKANDEDVSTGLRERVFNLREDTDSPRSRTPLPRD